MNERSSDPEFPAAEPLPGALGNAAAFSQSRRRLIRAGASAVPVIATLASRPVLGAAGQCNSTSAWGSTQLMATQSVTARATSQLSNITAWTIADWSSTDAPWTALNRYVEPAYMAGSGTALSQTYTVAMLFSDVGVPLGFTGGTAVKKVLGGMDPFQKSIVVAKLNLKVPLTNVGSCVTSLQVRDMGGGSYAPTIAVAPWGKTDIQAYLANNYIAR